MPDDGVEDPLLVTLERHCDPAPAEDRRRFLDRVERLRGEVARGERMLANEKFVANAKPEVVEAEREKLARYRRELDALSG